MAQDKSKRRTTKVAVPGKTRKKPTTKRTSPKKKKVALIIPMKLKKRSKKPKPLFT